METRKCKECGQELHIDQFREFKRKREVKNNGNPITVVSAYRMYCCNDCHAIKEKEKQLKKERKAREMHMEEAKMQGASPKWLTSEFLKNSKTCRVCKKRKPLNSFPDDVNLGIYGKSVCIKCLNNHENNK